MMTKRRNVVAYTGRSPRMEDRDGVIHFHGSTPTRWPAAGLARRKRPAEIAENAEIPGTHRGMSGGKGVKGGNLDSLGNRGPPDDAAKRRKPPETGGNRRALHWRGTSGVAEIAGNKFYVAWNASRG